PTERRGNLTSCMTSLRRPWAHVRLPRRLRVGTHRRYGCNQRLFLRPPVLQQASAPTPKTGLEATITADTAARCEAFSFIVAAAQAAWGLAMTGRGRLTAPLSAVLPVLWRVGALRRNGLNTVRVGLRSARR